jgi:hypothetical protein
MDFWPKDTGGGEKAMIQIIEDMTEIESLRQQLETRNKQYENLLNISALRETEQQEKLSDHIKREVMLRDALHHLWNERTPDSLDEAGEALSATADLEGFRLCNADPVIFSDRQTEPLYRAWEPK